LHLNQSELAWAAGFFDGEGCTSAARGIPIVAVTQAERATLERFQRAVGGIGKIFGPYLKPCAKSFTTRQPQYHYRAVRFEESQALIAMLWKYLSPPKRNQALALFKIYREYLATEPHLRVPRVHRSRIAA
jgi:hypothetical protein